MGGGGGRGVSLQWVSVGGYRCDKSRQSRTEAGAVGASRPTLNVGRKTNTGHAREKKKERRKRGGSGSLDMGAASGVKQCFSRLMTR